MQDTYIVKEQYTLSEYIGILYRQTFSMKIIKRIAVMITIAGILGGCLDIASPATKEKPWYGVALEFFGPILFFCLFLSSWVLLQDLSL